MANNWGVKLQLHAMGAVANNVQRIYNVHVICSPKMLQPNYELDNSLRSKSPNNTCNCCCSFNTKTLQELDVQKTMKDVET